MSERLETWVHMKQQEVDLTRIEERMEPDLAEKIYELDRCIECGCCVAACGTARMREDFVGAVGLNKIARFRLDPRDTRTDEDYYELIGDDNGVFGCMSLLACHDVCPKDLPLQTQIAFIRRKMVGEGLEVEPAPPMAHALTPERRAAMATHREGLPGREADPRRRLLRRADAARQGELPHHRHPDVAGAVLRQGVRLREEGRRARQPRPRRARRRRSPMRSPAPATG